MADEESEPTTARANGNPPGGYTVETGPRPAARGMTAASNQPHSGRWRWRAAVVVGVVAVALVLVSTASSKPSSSSPHTAAASPPSSAGASPEESTPATSLTGTPVAAEVAACQSDAQNVEQALQDFMAEKGSYPSPPSPWSVAAYAADYAPLTSSGGGGPYLQRAPGTTSYVIEYDATGHVWVAPPGAYQPAYDAGQSFTSNPNICLAAVA